MQITLETIITAACSDIKKLPNPDKTQQVYGIENEKEAKLVFDLLVVYGFDAKFYPENGTAKLYVSTPHPSALADTHKMTEMHSYACSFAALKAQAEQLAFEVNTAAPTYRLGFSNSSVTDKQITIHISSPKRATTANSPAPAPQRQQRALQTAISTTSKQEDIFLGPEIMRPPGRRKSNQLKTEGPDSLWKQCKLYIKGNSIIAALVIIATIALTIVLLSLFVLSKAFLCPDFASMKDKTPPWYCK